jgi:hypothetical protein
MAAPYKCKNVQNDLKHIYDQQGIQERKIKGLFYSKFRRFQRNNLQYLFLETTNLTNPLHTLLIAPFSISKIRVSNSMFTLLSTLDHQLMK